MIRDMNQNKDMISNYKDSHKLNVKESRQDFVC